MEQVIVVGGGLAGLSAAHTVLERGGRVVLVDKNSFCGGNSTKATSGINGSSTTAQRKLGINDSAEIFEKDSMRGGATQPELVKVLTHESGQAIDWLIDSFSLDLSLVSRLGGHSEPRTHRGKEKFPGMTITYALLEKLEEIAEKSDRAKILLSCKMVELLKVKETSGDEIVVGIKYEDKEKKIHILKGPVILATGGYGADFSSDSLLMKHRSDLKDLPTTNGQHCTGDGIKVAQRDLEAGTVDLEFVQVHPTGLVNPDEKDQKVLFLAAEALRGVGGVLIDSCGRRIANELGRRDYVSDCMHKNKGPFRLLLNSAASKEIEWHCKHYKSRKLMKSYDSLKTLADEMKIEVSVLKDELDKYNYYADMQKKEKLQGPYEAYGGGKTYDPFGKKFFHNTPLIIDDSYHVSIVTPVIHYCMGGIKIDTTATVLRESGEQIKGLYGAGEINGGVHGQNRLGGSSLLDCVVYGRVAGRTASAFLQEKNIKFIQSRL